MSRHFPPPVPDGPDVQTIMIDAARCWRSARDNGRATQPCLSQTLDQRGCGMLAPVLDSLCLIYEAALGRPMTVGEALALSDDEQLLLGLVDGSQLRQCLTCPQGVGATFDCALCSTRIMLGLTVGQHSIEQNAF